MTDRHPDLDRFDAAVAEHEARQLADEIGYGFAVLTDGTFVLEPPADPNCCGICAHAARVEHTAKLTKIAAKFAPMGYMPDNDGDHCADCGTPLDALNRCQIPVPDPAGGLGFTLRFVCRQHYVDRAR